MHVYSYSINLGLPRTAYFKITVELVRYTLHMAAQALPERH
jgi:hypothetical protein